jgi:Ca-activated chloride channel family protein
LSALILLLPVHPAHASTASAKLAYSKGDYIRAAREYAAVAQDEPNAPALQFNLGTAAYKAGRFGEAAQAFQASVGASQTADAKRLAEQEDAYYDLGNTMYRSGQKTEQSNTQQTIDSWTRAVKAYDAALQLRANDADSKFNRDLVRRKLDALKKKQPEQDQQKKSGSGAQQQKQPENSQTKDQKQAQQQQSGQQAQDNNQQKGSQTKDQKQAQQQQQQSGQQAQGKNEQKGSQTQGEQQSQQPPGRLAQNGSQQQTPAPSHATSQPQSRAQPSDQLAPQTSLSAGQPRRANQGGGLDQREDSAAQIADSQHLPGEMSREEARELLDSVKDEERRLPTMPVARNGANDTSSDGAIKDW